MPCRATGSLYAFPETVTCAEQGCVPCAYKIGLFDVALDQEFCQSVPNQRPEQCPRLWKNRDQLAPSAARNNASETHHGYRPGMSVLAVGDGDFSFSLAVARRLFSTQDEKETLQPSRLIATSYEKEETLRRVYPDFDQTINELHQLGAETFFQVDATRLEATLPPKSRKVASFHRICWNFPCTAIGKGQDGQNSAMEQNKDLVRAFVANAVPLLAPAGEIHMCHKSKPPFNQWKLESVALESLDAPEDGLTFAGRLILDRALLPPYTPRKALDRKSFPCHDACFYVFEAPSNSQEPSMPSTLLLESTDKPPHAPISITPEMIASIRRSLLKRSRSQKRAHSRPSNRGKKRRIAR